MAKLSAIFQDGQILFPIEFGGVIYYVRFVRRGSRLDCSGVVSFGTYNGGNRLTPQFCYENKNEAKIRRVIKAAREVYLLNG